MTEPQTANPDSDHHVGDRVRIYRLGQREPGRISSVHRHIEYVLRIDDSTSRYGVAVSVWTTSGQSSCLGRTSVRGEHR